MSETKDAQIQNKTSSSLRKPGSSGPFRKKKRDCFLNGNSVWIPAFAGMTMVIIMAVFSYKALAAEAPLAASSALCRAVLQYTQNADVAYAPGVDVHGKPIVPADLNGEARMDLPEEIIIPLTADLFGFLGLDQTSFPFNKMPRNDINLGTLIVRGADVFYNGKPLTDEQQGRLTVLCKEKNHVH